MSKKLLVLWFLVIGCGLFVADCCAQVEYINITTYYPSPYGVYRILRIYPNDDNAPGAACSNEGEMYYDKSEHGLYICSGSPLTWVPSGGGAGPSATSYWSPGLVNPNDIYNTNTGNVGIGTSSPSSGSGGQLKLDVEGAIGATKYCDENGNNCRLASTAIGGFSNIQVFDANGAFTVPAGVSRIMVEVWGPGGYGGQGGDALMSVGGAGGGGGGYCKSVISVIPGQTFAVTVISRLTTGGNSQFSGPGVLITASQGGTGEKPHYEGGLVIVARGGVGGLCTNAPANSVRSGGNAGETPLGAGGRGGAAAGGGGGGGRGGFSGETGANGSPCGGGGGGGGYYNLNGGAGGAGRVVVWY